MNREDGVQALLLRSVTPRSDCLLWTGATYMGYGRISVDGKNIRAHRFAWESARGPIPEGMTVDHLCEVKTCINPEHMELVSVSENSARANASFARRRRRSGLARRDVCRNGHPLTEDNVYRRPNEPDYLVCRTCERDRNARRKARRAEPRSPGRWGAPGLRT